MKHWAGATYAVHLLVSNEAEKPIYRWAQWQHIASALESVLAITEDLPVIRSCQVSHDSYKNLPFGRMKWSDKNNEKWTEKYQSVDPSVRFINAEIWSPDWNTMASEHRTPSVFVQVEARPTSKFAQALTIAVREPEYTNNLSVVRHAVEKIQRMIPCSTHYFGRTPWAETVYDYGYGNGISDRSADTLSKQLVLVAA